MAMKVFGDYSEIIKDILRIIKRENMKGNKLIYYDEILSKTYKVSNILSITLSEALIEWLLAYHIPGIQLTLFSDSLISDHAKYFRWGY